MATIEYEDLIREGEESTEQMVEVERADGYAVLTMSDPGKLNVLSAALMVQTRAAAAELVADNDVKAIVLTGAGKAFSTGGDLRLMKRATEHLADPAGEGGSFEIWRWIREQFGGMSRLIANSDKAFIAAINGPGGRRRPGLRPDLRHHPRRRERRDRPRVRPPRPDPRGRHQLGTHPPSRLPAGVRVLRRRQARDRRRGRRARPRQPRRSPTTSCCPPPASGASGSPPCRATRSRWRSRSCARPPTCPGSTPCAWRSSPSRTASRRRRSRGTWRRCWRAGEGRLAQPTLNSRRFPSFALKPNSGIPTFVVALE